MRTATSRMQPDYSRQILLKDVGTAGQAVLAASRVLIVGAGGLGSPVLQYLAGAGVGFLGLVEADVSAGEQPASPADLRASASRRAQGGTGRRRGGEARIRRYASRRMPSASAPTTRCAWCRPTTWWSIAPTISAPNSSSTMPRCSPSVPPCLRASISTRASCRSTSRSLPTPACAACGRTRHRTASSATAPRRASSGPCREPSVPCRRS